MQRTIKFRSMIMRTFILTIILFISSFSIISAQTVDGSKIAEAVEKQTSQNGFSGTILVAEKGQTIFQESYGLAYYSTPDTIRNNYHFSIASVTKLFTSIRVLQLLEEGKLSLDDSVNDYLPKFKEQISDEVSIKHLLLHISGLPEDKDKMYRQQYEPAAFATKVLETRSKNSVGTFNYNNLDYILLGLIIENLTGNTWDKEIQQVILKPLGMEETGFLEYGYYPRDFGYSYSLKRNKLVQDPLFYIENFYSAGNMYSTANDLLKLDQALYSNQLLSYESKELLMQSYPEYNYVGFGVWNYNYPYVEGSPTVMERRGGILGANVVLVRLTDDNYTIIILSNDDRFNPDSFGDNTNLREILIRTLYSQI